MGKLISIWLIELLINLYDIVTLPIYFIIQKPWRVRRDALKVRSHLVGENTWTNVEGSLEGYKEFTTLDQLFRSSVSLYADKDCLGVRKILAVEYKESAKNGLENGASVPTKPVVNKRTIYKYDLDTKYTWYTYRQVEEFVIKLSAGLVSLCNDSLENLDGSRKLLICADTCMQWFLMAQACFRNNVTVVTAYTNLDDNAILHGIQQTEVKILVVSQKVLPRLPKIIQDAPQIDTIIVLDEPLPGEVDEVANLKNLLSTTNVRRIISYHDILARGEETKEAIVRAPSGDDIAVLMYTSGSTGQAKGVLLSHKSIVYTTLSFSGPGELTKDDRYIGYLPLGHVLELAAECIFLKSGSIIAYSSPMTLTCNSPMVKKNQLGDANIIKPTIIASVPLILDRIRSSIQQVVRKQGPFYDQFINDFVVRYKRYWWDQCYDTPLMNYFICRKFNLILGGEVRAVCSGGAALSRETQEYLRHVTNFVVIQGYGLTETSAAASFCDVHERRYNVVGAPYPIVNIKLESWSDYSVDDKPYPRGEVIVGGQPVSAGYYKMPELTEESFYVDSETGVRYFRTGDIGMMLPDGVLKIIDRKKDIVKPLCGEYISLTEIETVLKTVPIVENVCVYCSQYSNHIIALVRPFDNMLRQLAHQLFIKTGEDTENYRRSIQKAYEAEYQIQSDDCVNWDSNESRRIIEKLSHTVLCSNKWITAKVLRQFRKQGIKSGLKETQLPSNIRLVGEEWSQESGLVTASFKIRRREVERFYAETIKQLYAELGQKIDQNT